MFPLVPNCATGLPHKKCRQNPQKKKAAFESNLLFSVAPLILTLGFLIKSGGEIIISLFIKI